MAKKEKKKNNKKSSGSKLPLMFIMPAVLLLIIALKASFLLILLGILPTVVAYYADTTDDKMGVATVACCNLSGVMPYIAELTSSGNKWEILSIYLSNINVWLMMYGMAGIGYVLIKICPYAFNISLRTIHGSKAFQLQQRQDALVKEWGESITILQEKGS